MRVEHPNAGEGDGVAPAQVDVDGDNTPVGEEGTFEIPDDATGWLRRFTERHGVDPDDIVREEDGPPDAGGADAPNPSDHSVADLRDILNDIDDVDVLEAVLERERDGKDRETGVEAIESRINAVQED
jgi:hypothetical protein